MPKKNPDGSGSYYKEGKRFCWRIMVESNVVVRKRNTKEELKREVLKVLTELEQKGALVPKGSEPTVRQALTHWLENRVKPNRAWKTYENHESHCRLHIFPVIGNVKVSKVTAGEVQKVVATMQGSDEDYTGSSILSTIRTLCAGLNLSSRELRRQGLELPSESPGRDRVLSEEEIGEVLEELYRKRGLKTRPGEEAHLYRDRHLVMFLLNTGLRISEALGIVVPMVNLREGWLEVKVQLKRSKDKKGAPTWELGDTKTRQTRRVPLNEEAIKAVRAQIALIGNDQHKAGDGYENNGLLFATESGKPHTARNALRTLERVQASIDKERAKSGLDPIDSFSLHDLRRSYLTHLAAVEDKLQNVMRIAGHTNPATTMRHYVHAQEKGMREASQKISFGRKEKEA